MSYKIAMSKGPYIMEEIVPVNPLARMLVARGARNPKYRYVPAPPNATGILIDLHMQGWMLPEPRREDAA